MLCGFRWWRMSGGGKASCMRLAGHDDRHTCGSAYVAVGCEDLVSGWWEV